MSNLLPALPAAGAIRETVSPGSRVSAQEILAKLLELPKKEEMQRFLEEQLADMPQGGRFPEAATSESTTSSPA